MQAAGDNTLKLLLPRVGPRKARALKPSTSDKRETYLRSLLDGKVFANTKVNEKDHRTMAQLRGQVELKTLQQLGPKSQVDEMNRVLDDEVAKLSWLSNSDGGGSGTWGGSSSWTTWPGWGSWGGDSWGDDDRNGSPADDNNGASA